MGYHRAGFDVVGVDIEAQPNYPFEFVQGNAMRWLAEWGSVPTMFDAIHASPPCQAYSDLQRRTGRSYPELIEPVRELLIANGLAYIIENVEGAPLIDPPMLCGTMFSGLRVLCHRLFETNFPTEAPPHRKHPLVFTHDKRKAHHGNLDQNESFVQVTGGGNCSTTCVIGRPDSNTSRVARSSNSSGYFLVLVITEGSPSPADETADQPPSKPACLTKRRETIDFGTFALTHSPDSPLNPA